VMEPRSVSAWVGSFGASWARPADAARSMMVARQREGRMRELQYGINNVSGGR
jgi:hypothetical protein